MAARSNPILLIPAMLVFAASSVTAQVHGVPASVSSFGFGGSFSSTPGVAASVSSLGPNGFGRQPGFQNCCFSGFHFGDDFRSLRRHHRPQVAVFPVPVYTLPYTPVIVVQADGVGYGDDSGEVQVVSTDHRMRPRHVRERFVETEPEEETKAQPATAALPPSEVAAQPSTVLVFKDGHQSEIQNYAIVGDTLFDLAENRAHRILLADLDIPATLKANSDRGVDFRLPPAR